MSITVRCAAAPIKRPITADRHSTFQVVRLPSRSTTPARNDREAVPIYQVPGWRHTSR